MKPTIKPSPAELRKASKAVDTLLAKILGRDEYGDAYAKGIIVDRRVHEHFPYHPEGRQEEKTEQSFTDAVTCAEINLHLATTQLEQANREFRYWLEDRRYRQAVEIAVSKALKAPASFSPTDLSCHIHCEVYSATNSGSQRRPEPEDIAAEAKKNASLRLPGRNIEQLFISTQYSTRIYAIYTPTVEEVEAKIKLQKQAITDVDKALTPAGLKARKFPNLQQRKAFIQRATDNRTHTLKAIEALTKKL